MTDSALPLHPEDADDLVYVTSIRTGKEVKALIAKYGHLVNTQSIIQSSNVGKQLAAHAAQILQKLLPGRTSKQVSIGWLRQVVSSHPVAAAADKRRREDDEEEKEQDELVRSVKDYVNKRRARDATVENALAAMQQEHKDLQILRNSLIQSTHTFNETLKQQWLADPGVQAKITAPVEKERDHWKKLYIEVRQQLTETEGMLTQLRDGGVAVGGERELAHLCDRVRILEAENAAMRAERNVV